MNRPKQIGTAGESGLVRTLRSLYAFPDDRCRRMTLGGRYDVGDVHAEFPDGVTVVIEVKSGKQADAATLKDLGDWQAETDVEARNAGTPYRMLVVKRRSVSPDRMLLWRAFLPIPSPAADRDVWIELPLYEAMAWLSDEHGGYAEVSDTLIA